MNYKIRQLTSACALVAASILFVISSARAEVTSLVCGSGSRPVKYWVDTASNTITLQQLLQLQTNAPYTLQTFVYPVQITAVGYSWHNGPTSFYIDRMTGRMTVTNPPNVMPSVSVMQCSKGLPMPAPKL